MTTPSRFGIRTEHRRPDAQPFLPDAEYVKKGAGIDDSDTSVQRTILGNGDVFYGVNTTSGNVTVTLPEVDKELGRTHIIKRTTDGANGCNIVPAEGTAILDHSATHSIAVQDGVRAYFSDGSRWRSVSTMAGDNAEVASGLYTPTLTNVTNLDASGVTAQFQYLRIGNVVTVSGRVTVDATAAAGTTTTLGISLPIATTFASTGNCAGAASAFTVLQAGIIEADTANNRASLRYAAQTTANTGMGLTFTYRIA